MPSPLETISPDALFITFPVTDGDGSRRPDNMNRPALSAREVNWHRTMTMEEKYVCRWRNLIGQGIAMLLGKPDKEKYCLQSFPAGYGMFDHNKGPISNVRHDLYLYGSKTVLRFRSPAEFIPHGFWLLTDPTLNQSNCGCKYCGGSGKKSQTEISEALGLHTNRGRTATTGDVSTRMRVGVQRPARSTKTRGISSLPADTPWVPRASRQERKTRQTGSLKLKLAASITRISDLRADRIFRTGELVWCVWEEGTYNRSPRTGVNQLPSFWPAIVLEYSLESVVDPSSSNCGSYSVLHKRLYSLLRLGSLSEEMRMQFECVLYEDAILPWQAHQIGLGPLQPMSPMNNQSDGPVDHFIFALRTAKRLADFWAVCNRLPIKVPSPSLSRNPQTTEDSSSGSQVPQCLSTPDRHTDSVPSMPFLFVPDSTDMPPQRSPARLKLLSPIKRNSTTDVLVDKPYTSTSTHELPSLEPSPPVQPSRTHSKETTVTETRYEGLWYGAERIWMGDVVRLCPERDAFAESLRLSYVAQGYECWKQKITPSPGAAMRGVLMRVDRIFTRVGNTGWKECAVAGPLYEVAPKDWTKAAKLPTHVLPPNTSGLSSTSRSEEVYYPWDMPQTPPPYPDRDKVGSRGDSPVRLPSYPLPPAPPGYTLHPLLPPESEMTFPASFIAGRYYPTILQWPLSVPVLSQVTQDISSLSLAAAAKTRGVSLLSLCGLAPGRFNHAVCVDVRLASRTRMIAEATCLAGSQGKNPDGMVVDGE